MNKIKNYLSIQYKWYVTKMHIIVLIVGLHIVSSYVVKLPYINIFTSLFSFLPYFFDWIAILILFRPNKELILKIGLLLFVVDFLFALIKFNFILETLGEVSYLMIGTYIIFSLKEFREKSR